MKMFFVYILLFCLPIIASERKTEEKKVAIATTSTPKLTKTVTPEYCQAQFIAHIIDLSESILCGKRAKAGADELSKLTAISLSFPMTHRATFKRNHERLVYSIEEVMLANTKHYAVVITDGYKGGLRKVFRVHKTPLVQEYMGSTSLFSGTQNFDFYSTMPDKAKGINEFSKSLPFKQEFQEHQILDLYLDLKQGDASINR